MNKTILIISGSSDIGLYLIDRYLSENCRVIATYRNQKHLEIKPNENRNNLTVLPLNIGNYIQRLNLYDYMLKQEIYWDTCVFLNATLEPIGKFMEVDGPQWEKSIEENALIPCTFLQRLYKVRNSLRVCDVAYFSGGGINGTFDNYSSYTISKTILHKFVELINSEYKDLNPFIIGPGWVKTKIHQQTLDNKETAGENYQKTLDFMNSRGKGVSLEDIYNCLEWCCKSGKKIVGGRNISVLHDPWEDPKFMNRLKRNKDYGKMRRKA